jgi:hypothetical protein
MIWMTWRQSRAQAVTAIAALAAFALLLAVTGPHLAGLYRASGISACHGARCGLLASGFLNRLAGVDPVVYTLGIAAIVGVPAVIGIFWGAPLIARELETGTFRLAWTQSITRTRWLAAKLALTGAAAMAVAQGLSLMFGWWAAPIGQAARLAVSSTFPLGMGPFSLLAFDAHGLAPLGYAAFAFALGVASGVVLRRTIPAMAITLAIFAAIQVVMPLGIRPAFLPARPDDRRDQLLWRGTGDRDNPKHLRVHRRRGPPGPARRLDPLHRRRQLRRADRQRDPGRLQAGSGERHLRLPGLPDKPRCPSRRHLPAHQPLLGYPVDRDSDLPRPRSCPGRVLLLAARSPHLLTGQVVAGRHRGRPSPDLAFILTLDDPLVLEAYPVAGWAGQGG